MGVTQKRANDLHEKVDGPGPERDLGADASERERDGVPGQELHAEKVDESVADRVDERLEEASQSRLIDTHRVSALGHGHESESNTDSEREELGAVSTNGSLSQETVRDEDAAKELVMVSLDHVRRH